MSTSNLKVSIAALSLCVSAVAIYIHLPYVIIAVSGSGAIEAVPLAVFTVSMVVALISAIYLIRLAAGEKPVEQDRGSQIKVDSGTSLRDESGVPTSSSQPPQTRVTAVFKIIMHHHHYLLHLLFHLLLHLLLKRLRKAKKIKLALLQVHLIVLTFLVWLKKQK